MSLPKIDTPLFEMDLISQRGPVTYRPFLVKEEKILFLSKKISLVEFGVKKVNTLSFSKDIWKTSPYFFWTFLVNLRALFWNWTEWPT